MLILVLVLKDSLRTKFKSLSWSLCVKYVLVLVSLVLDLVLVLVGLVLGNCPCRSSP